MDKVMWCKKILRKRKTWLHHTSRNEKKLQKYRNLNKKTTREAIYKVKLTGGSKVQFSSNKIKSNVECHVTKRSYKIKVLPKEIKYGGSSCWIEKYAKEFHVKLMKLWKRYVEILVNRIVLCCAWIEAGFEMKFWGIRVTLLRCRNWLENGCHFVFWDVLNLESRFGMYWR